MPSSFTFTVGTGGNWAIPQTVTVTSVADDDEFDDLAEIEHTAVLAGITNRWRSVFVSVTDSNRAPYFEEGLDTTREVPETAGQGTNVGAPVTALDLNSDTLTYELDDSSGNFEITASNSASGQITVAANNSLDYEKEPDHEVKVTATDPGGLLDAIYVKVIIRGENKTPVISGLSAPEFNENATGRITRYTATDPERDSFTWSVTGADASDFSIDSRGYLSINNPLNYETKSTYSVTIVATDDADPPNAGELPVTIMVRDVNEAPEIVSGSDNVSYTENHFFLVEPYGASDPEGDTPITWSLSGTDGGDFSITSTGLLQFRQTPDYERPRDSNRDNIYRFAVRAFDGRLTGAKDGTVTVGNVNEAPTVSGDATLTFPENTATTRVLDRYSATHPERGQITWSLVGDDQNDFLIDQSGNLTFASMPDYESPSDSGGNNEYRVTVVATDDGSPSQVGPN